MGMGVTPGVTGRVTVPVGVSVGVSVGVAVAVLSVTMTASRSLIDPLACTRRTLCCPGDKAGLSQRFIKQTSTPDVSFRVESMMSFRGFRLES